MSGPKRNPDKLNTIGIVVVGICGAVLVYSTMTALQAFYMSDTSEVQTAADYGKMDEVSRGKKADELRNINEPASNPGGNGTYRMKIDDAMKLVIEDAKTNPAHLGGSKLPDATKPTIAPVYARPPMGGAAPATPTPPTGAGSAAPAGAGSAAPAGAGSAAPTGAGSAAPAAGAAGSAAPQTPTGAPSAPAAASPGTAAGSAAGSGAHR